MLVVIGDPVPDKHPLSWIRDHGSPVTAPGAREVGSQTDISQGLVWKQEAANDSSTTTQIWETLMST